MHADLIVHDASEILTCRGPAPRRGAAQADAGAMADGSVAVLDGHIVFVGPAEECRRSCAPSRARAWWTPPAATILPGFVDAHTHAMFAGDRRDELRRRLAGATSGDRGAGRRHPRDGRGETAPRPKTTSCRTRPASREMLACGTTTAEIKSGYGLTVESELKMLRAIRRLAPAPVDSSRRSWARTRSRCEYRTAGTDYVRLVIDEMIPAVAAEGSPSGATSSARAACSRRTNRRAILQAGRARG